MPTSESPTRRPRRDAAIAQAQADANARVRAAEEDRDGARKAAAVAEAITGQAKQEATRAQAAAEAAQAETKRVRADAERPSTQAAPTTPANATSNQCRRGQRRPGRHTRIPTTARGLFSALPAVEAESSLIDRIVREGARQMLAAALQAGAEAYIGRFADERNENGRQPVVRNGSAQARTLLTSAGAVQVTA